MAIKLTYFVHGTTKAPQLALDVLLKHKTWEQAFAEDWRKTKAWKPGWEYDIE